MPDIHKPCTTMTGPSADLPPWGDWKICGEFKTDRRSLGSRCTHYSRARALTSPMRRGGTRPPLQAKQKASASGVAASTTAQPGQHREAGEARRPGGRLGNGVTYDR